MIRYLLDTTVLSDFARGDRNVHARLVTTPPSRLAVTTITVMEVEYGLALSTKRAKTIRPVLDAILGTLTRLAYSDDDARATATLRAVLRKRGTPIGPYDALIAGTAVSRGLLLVTSNTGEFERVPGLEVEDWRT